MRLIFAPAFYDMWGTLNSAGVKWRPYWQTDKSKHLPVCNLFVSLLGLKLLYNGTHQSASPRGHGIGTWPSFEDSHSWTCRQMYGRLSSAPSAGMRKGCNPHTIQPSISKCIYYFWGTVVAHWLRCRATNLKVAGSIPAGVNGFFIDIKSFRLHYGPGVDSASNRKDYREYFLGVKAAGASGWQPTTILCRCHEIWEP